MAAAPDDPVSVRLLSPAVVEINNRGRVTAAIIQESVARALKLMSAGGVKAVLISTTEMANLDAAARSVLPVEMGKLLAAGAELIVGILPNAAMRMVATAIAFAAGHPSKVVRDRVEAYAVLRQRGWL